jgi:predicted Zn-dependent protease
MITWSSKFFILSFLLLSLGLTTGCIAPHASNVSLLHGQTSVDPDELWLWQKSAQAQRAIETKGRIYPDQELETYLNKLVARLQAQSSPADLEIRVKVIKSADLNAFSYPNGMIYIHTGLLARMDNEAQLAAVLAHEMTHCIRRHALRAFRRYKDQSAFQRVVEHTLLKTNGFLSELEAEADRVGLDLMASAGYDPGEALVFRDRIMAESEQDGREASLSFGSHFNARQRIENLQNLLTSGYTNTSTRIKNSELFLAKLNTLLLGNAELDIRQGRFQAARRSVDKYLRINPDDTRAYFLLGEIYRRRGQVDDSLNAIKFYKQAIFLDPTYAEPHKAIGLIHYKKGQRTLAKQFFELSLQLSPDSPDKAYIQAYLKQCTQGGEG